MSPGDCSCPLCAEAARNGETLWTVNDKGELVQLPPVVPEMMMVTIRGEGPVATILAPWPVPMEIPVGCVAGDLLAYLGWKNRDLYRMFPPFMLAAVIAGDVCDDRQVIRPGDEVTVRAARGDPLAALLAARLARVARLA